MAPSSPLRREVSETLRLAFPLILAQLGQIGMPAVDTIMIGRLGASALAAGAVGSQVFVTAMLLGFGLALAVGPQVAQAFGAWQAGRGPHAAVGLGTRQGLLLALLTSLPLMALLGLAEKALLGLGQPPETSALAAAYVQAVLWGMPANLGFVALRGLVDGIGQPRITLLMILLGLTCNVVCNYVLMYGIGPFPAMGLVGCGWASALSYWVMFGVMAVYVHRSERTRAFAVFAPKECRPHLPTLRELTVVGLPIGVALLAEGGIFACAALLMGWISTTAQAAHQIALNAASITFMVPLGVAMAATVRVGQAVGRGDAAGVARAGWVSIGLGVAVMAGAALLFAVAPGAVVAVYLGVPPSDAAVAAVAVSLLQVAAVFQLVDGTQVVAAGALRGLKDTRAVMVVGVLAYWGVGLTAALGLAFGLNLGAVGIWWGLTLGLVTAAVLLVGRFWAQIRQRRRTPPPP